MSEPITLAGVQLLLSSMLAYIADQESEDRAVYETDLRIIDALRFAISQAETIRLQGEEIERLREITANALCPCGNKADTKTDRSTCSEGSCYGCLSDRIWEQHDELILLKRVLDMYNADTNSAVTMETFRALKSEPTEGK